MSYYKHPLDGIHVGDYVAMEVVTMVDSHAYAYQVSGEVRIYDGVKAVGCTGLGGGRIIEHRTRPLPTAFGSHIRYPETGVEWVKTTASYWRSNAGSVRAANVMRAGWVLVRDAGLKRGFDR